MHGQQLSQHVGLYLYAEPAQSRVTMQLYRACRAIKGAGGNATHAAIIDDTTRWGLQHAAAACALASHGLHPILQPLQKPCLLPPWSLMVHAV